MSEKSPTPRKPLSGAGFVLEEDSGVETAAVFNGTNSKRRETGSCFSEDVKERHSCSCCCLEGRVKETENEY